MNYLLLIFIVFLTLFEMFALYNLKKFNITRKLYYYLAAVVTYIIVISIFCYSLSYEKIGSMNHSWNIGSSLLGFAIGYYIFKESLNGVELTGISLSLIGLLILAIGSNNK